MQTFTDPSSFPTLSDTCVTIGNFDGVHIGHQQLLRKLSARAVSLGGRSCAITFEPHPVVFFEKTPDKPFILSPIDEKVRLLAQQSVDFLLVLPFERVAPLTYQEFVSKYLVDTLHARFVLVGHDFSFGKGRRGTVHELADEGARLDFDVERFGPILQGESPISSTRVREALWRGDVALANKLLGRPYALRGTVVRGDARGRQLGFPTANFAAPSSTLIPDGVYFTRLSDREGRTFPAATSLGTRPTFSNDGQRLVETYVLQADSNFDLYDQEVSVDFLCFIRPQRTFASSAHLITQMERDVEDCMNQIGGEFDVYGRSEE